VSKRFFFEKKNQKTFVYWGHERWKFQRPWPRVKKIFLLLFLQKKKFLLITSWNCRPLAGAAGCWLGRIVRIAGDEHLMRDVVPTWIC
jgi:hypothetical protein